MTSRVGLLEQPVIVIDAGKPRRFDRCNGKEPIGSYVLHDVKGEYSHTYDWGHVHASRKGNKVHVTFSLPQGIRICDCKAEEKRRKNAMKRPAKRAARAAKRRHHAFA